MPVAFYHPPPPRRKTPSLLLVLGFCALLGFVVGFAIAIVQAVL